jgi:hypothetical protein
MKLALFRFGAFLGSLRQTRFGCLLVMTLLCLVLRENYPFSHFPMYSSFSRSTYFLYLADEKGAPLSTKRFGLTSSTLKKIFDGERRKALREIPGSYSDRVPAAEEAAGRALLRYLDRLVTSRPQLKNSLHGVQLVHVRVALPAEKLVLETGTIVTHD